MTLQAKRFAMLSKETNLPIADFTKSMGGDVLNSAENALSEVSSSVQSMMDTLKQSDVASKLGELKDDSTRMARDALSSMKDLTGFTQDGVAGILGDFLPSGNAFKKLFNNLSSRCRTAAASGINFGNGFDVDAKCGGNGKSGCTSGQFSDILNDLTGGLSGALGKALGKLINGIIALGKLGLDLGVCGILTALSGLAGGAKGVLNMAAGALFGTVAANKNTKGIFSLANDVVGLGLKPSKIVPGASGMAVNNFSLMGTGSAGTKDYFETFDLSVREFDPNYDKSASGGLSVAKFTGQNSSFSSAAGKYALTSAASLSGQTTSSAAHFAAAAAAKAKSSFKSISSLF